MSDAEELQNLIEEASAVYDEAMLRRHEMGNQKYGPVKFLSVNSIQEAMAEIVDLGNYARYTFIKLYMLDRYLRESTESVLGAEEATELLGPNSFIPNGNHGT